MYSFHSIVDIVFSIGKARGLKTAIYPWQWLSYFLGQYDYDSIFFSFCDMKIGIYVFIYFSLSLQARRSRPCLFALRHRRSNRPSRLFLFRFADRGPVSSPFDIATPIAHLGPVSSSIAVNAAIPLAATLFFKPSCPTHARRQCQTLTMRHHENASGLIAVIQQQLTVQKKFVF